MEEKDWTKYAVAGFTLKSPPLEGNYRVVFQSSKPAEISRPNIPISTPVQLAVVNVATKPEVKVVNFRPDNMCIKELTQDMLEEAAIDVVKHELVRITAQTRKG